MCQSGSPSTNDRSGPSPRHWCLGACLLCWLSECSSRICQFYLGCYQLGCSGKEVDHSTSVIRVMWSNRSGPVCFVTCEKLDLTLRWAAPWHESALNCWRLTEMSGVVSISPHIVLVHVCKRIWSSDSLLITTLNRYKMLSKYLLTAQLTIEISANLQEKCAI